MLIKLHEFHIYFTCGSQTIPRCCAIVGAVYDEYRTGNVIDDFKDMNYYFNNVTSLFDIYGMFLVIKRDFKIDEIVQI